ncbi:MAG TPA: nuclear transport factor 2 family protein [Gemmatimonadaceae bacterium]|jgi:ketosteroid isomerase-like protein|nr:nuclear transport factor 2 family protein [Gemmatimonadaceae bacterium]
MNGLTSFDPVHVEAFLRDWTDWFDAAKYREMAACYAEDARLVATGTPTLRGRAPIERFWQLASERARSTGVRRTIMLEQAESGGDVGYMRGTVALALPGAAEPAVVRFATLWKRQADGVWRLVEDISCPAPQGPAG